MHNFGGGPHRMLPQGICRHVLACVGLTVLVGCNEQRLQQGFEEDDTAPVVSVVKTAGDTLQLADGIIYAVTATDNLGIKDVSVALSAGFTSQFDTTFTTAITNVTLNFNTPLPANSTAGGVIVITATVTDGNDNVGTAVDSLFLVNAQALTVRVLDPQAGAVTTPGRQIPVNVQATQNTGIRWVGYTTTGVVTAADSTAYALPDTAVFSGNLTVPQNAQTGTFQITGFAEDSSGRRVNSSPVTVTVQEVVQDANPPFVTFSVAARAEVTDSITVTANDPSGVTLIEWFANDLNGNLVGSGSTTSGGTLTQVSDTYALGFTFTTFPQLIEISAFGTDANGNRGEARVDTAVTSRVLRDTITVVNGITKRLPEGGTVIDAIFNPKQNEFYLTNRDLNRLEVFRVADTSYVPGGIRVGSEPWGLALWPANQAGNYFDTVVVANSGGTNLSIVDVRPGVRAETRRHALPNFLVQSVQTEIDPATSTLKIKIQEFDFSDRPQYLGVTCRAAPCATPGNVFAVYSTAPTPGQTPEFQNRGTVRWESLDPTANNSHFFWEQAARPPDPDYDSLQVLVDRGPNLPIDTVLSVAKGIMVDLGELAFQDPTFVRSSGDATHALIGEGGDIDLARAIGYDGTAALVSTVDTTVIEGVQIFGPSVVDLGITPGIRVRDFIANAATQVKSIAINFNGLTNLVRADSIYVLNENMRLAGVIPVAGDNPGMDLNFQHAFDPFVGGTAGTFGGTLNPDFRMVFLARPDANIDVYDTFFFKRIATIPVRDPIIGPVRVALLPGGTEQILVGVTARGVVTVRFPQVTNIFPDPVTDLPSGNP